MLVVLLTLLLLTYMPPLFLPSNVHTDIIFLLNGSLPIPAYQCQIRHWTDEVGVAEEPVFAPPHTACAGGAMMLCIHYIHIKKRFHGVGGGGCTEQYVQ